MKVCRSCGVLKPLSDFYHHRHCADGHEASCKGCRREYFASRPRERIAEIDRKRNQAPKRKADKVRFVQRHRGKHPDRYRARTAVTHAISDGWLSRAPCQVCGNTRVEAHHEDYSRPLDVVWLCPSCHARRHAELRWHAELRSGGYGKRLKSAGNEHHL